MGHDQADAYFTKSGPLDGPILRDTLPPTIGVSFDEKHPERSDGIAFASGSILVGRKLIAMWRLVVRKEPIGGLWVCDRQRFVRVEDWVERRAMREE